MQAKFSHDINTSVWIRAVKQSTGLCIKGSLFLNELNKKKIIQGLCTTDDNVAVQFDCTDVR